MDIKKVGNFIHKNILFPIWAIMYIGFFVVIIGFFVGMFGMLRTVIYSVKDNSNAKAEFIVECMDVSNEDKDETYEFIKKQIEIDIGWGNCYSPFRWTVKSFARNNDEFYDEIKYVFDDDRWKEFMEKRTKEKTEEVKKNIEEKQLKIDRAKDSVKDIVNGF
jgi:hypothetical protein